MGIADWFRKRSGRASASPSDASVHPAQPAADDPHRNDAREDGGGSEAEGNVDSGSGGDSGGGNGGNGGGGGGGE